MMAITTFMRYNDYPSTLPIKNKCTKVDKEQISIASKRLESKKVSKSNDIPLRITKEFSESFEGFLAINFNEYLNKRFFQMN